MRFYDGDLVRLKHCDNPNNQGLVGKPVRVAAQGTFEDPFWIDVVHEGQIHSVKGSDCAKLSTIVAGLDEVGRGAFAGPLVIVCAAFRITGPWDPSIPCPIPNVKDSKRYSKREKRQEAALAIKASPDLLGAGCGQVSHDEINQYGMSWAMRRAIHGAIESLKSQVMPDIILLDGNERAHGWEGKQVSTPKADDLWWPVSAASVLAKVYRDQFMVGMDSEYPGYNFSKNSGYGTPDHIEALGKLGPSPIHRKSFIRSTMEKLAQTPVL